MNMLCQDCLRVRPFTQNGHEGRERCECGGTFCGCADCEFTAELLMTGERDRYVLGLSTKIVNWTAKDGIEHQGTQRYHETK